MMKKNQKILPLSLAAIGIVYGDIGTSPLYALKETLTTLSITPENVMGVLSLVFWSLILIISVKYLMFVLRADNKGEGGILALLSLFKRHHEKKAYNMFFIVAILGTALLLGDAMLTPAISIISAIEGLQVIIPAFSHLTLPLTFTILLLLFFFQHFGTAKIGNLFGPTLLIWFITIAILGFLQIIKNPYIIQAINPYYGFYFFINNGLKGYFLLGGVFLVITGGEALYADLGHFGKLPIRISWFIIVLPCLLLNYFGQGACLLNNPEAISNPFYALSPTWFSFPLLILATLATIIASQAVISATFSLAKQAVLLDLYPKISIIQTSSEERGQVYVPQMNMILAVGTLFLILIFKSSSNLAHAYGVAVNLVMLSVSLLLIRVAYSLWKWHIIKIFLFFAFFLTIEFYFLGANLTKLHTGGWLPILFAIVGAIIMITWHQGIAYLRSQYYKERRNLKEAVKEFEGFKNYYLPDASWIFITDPYDKSGGSLFHYLELNHILPASMLIVSIVIENRPYIAMHKRFELTPLDKNIHRLIIHNGFMQLVNIPLALSLVNREKILPYHLDLKKVTYLIEITHIVPALGKSHLRFAWQEKLFAFLLRNSTWDIEFFRLPHNRTIAIGGYGEI